MQHFISGQKDFDTLDYVLLERVDQLGQGFHNTPRFVFVLFQILFKCIWNIINLFIPGPNSLKLKDHLNLVLIWKKPHFSTIRRCDCSSSLFINFRPPKKKKKLEDGGVSYKCFNHCFYISYALNMSSSTNLFPLIFYFLYIFNLFCISFESCRSAVHPLKQHLMMFMSCLVRNSFYKLQYLLWFYSISFYSLLVSFFLSNALCRFVTKHKQFLVQPHVFYCLCK